MKLSVPLAAAVLATLIPVGTSARAADGRPCGCLVGRSSAERQHAGAWRKTETANFQVVCCSADIDLPDVAEGLEATRQRLFQAWLGEVPREPWAPKCLVVLHDSAEGYARHSGQAARTSASSLVQRQRGRISLRRIDVRTDRPGWLTGASAHELTHVVLANRFASGTLPRWADEGMALLADTARKRALHRRDLDSAIADGAIFRVAELLSLQDYPPPDRWAAFYAQSISLTTFLMERESPSRFVQFLAAARRHGYDRALDNTYGIAGTGELERLWRQQLAERERLGVADQRTASIDQSARDNSSRLP